MHIPFLPPNWRRQTGRQEPNSPEARACVHQRPPCSGEQAPHLTPPSCPGPDAAGMANETGLQEKTGLQISAEVFNSFKSSSSPSSDKIFLNPQQEQQEIKNQSCQGRGAKVPRGTLYSQQPTCLSCCREKKATGYVLQSPGYQGPHFAGPLRMPGPLASGEGGGGLPPLPPELKPEAYSAGAQKLSSTTLSPCQLSRCGASSDQQ